MDKKQLIALMEKFERICRYLTHKWGMPEKCEELYSEMCYALVKKMDNFKNKPLSYIIKVCKNEAINNCFKGKSICSKPRKGLRIVSFEQLSEYISVERKFESDIHNKLLVEKIFRCLTQREKQVAELIMEGYTECEMAANFGISQPRVNCLKKKIRRKAKRILNRGL